jgi:hypothetical protein
MLKSRTEYRSHISRSKHSKLFIVEEREKKKKTTKKEKKIKARNEEDTVDGKDR